MIVVCCFDDIVFYAYNTFTLQASPQNPKSINTLFFRSCNKIDIRRNMMLASTGFTVSFVDINHSDMHQFTKCFYRFLYPFLPLSHQRGKQQQSKTSDIYQADHPVSNKIQRDECLRLHTQRKNTLQHPVKMLHSNNCLGSMALFLPSECNSFDPHHIDSILEHTIYVSIHSIHIFFVVGLLSYRRFLYVRFRSFWGKNASAPWPK